MSRQAQPLDLAVIGNNRIAALLDTKARLVWWCFPGWTAIRCFAA